MPVYSDYLYGGLSPLSYSSLLLSGRSSGSSGYSSGYSSGNYYGGGGGRSRYSPLLPTISESGLSPTIGRRSPRSAVSYTSSALYSPRTTPAYHVPRPVNINTENIDVSTPRKQIVRTPQVQENEVSSVPRSTIKRGRTVVRIHTKHAVKEDQNEDKSRRLKMTPGERLKEKYLLRESEWDKKKREKEEELIRSKEIEREESEKRFKRLMLLEEPLPLPDVLPLEIAEFSPQPELIPVQPEIRTVTEDLDTTPKNSSDEDTTDTESSVSSTGSVRKKKRKKESRRNSEVSIPEDDEVPIPPPRTRRKSNQLETDFTETKRDTIKRKLSNEKLNSIKGGVSKKKTTKKSKKIESKIKPVITSITFDSENNEPKSPKLYIENIVVEEEQIIMIKAPPKCRNKKKQITSHANKQKQKVEAKVSTSKVQDKLAVSTEIVSETLNTLPESTLNEESCKQKENNNLTESPTSCKVETPLLTAQNISENTSKIDTIPVVSTTPNETSNNNLKLLDWELPPKKWDRRESRMDWEWPDDTEESKPTPKGKTAKKQQLAKEISTSNKSAFDCQKVNNEKITETEAVKVPEPSKIDEKDIALKSTKPKTPTEKITITVPDSPKKVASEVPKTAVKTKPDSPQEKTNAVEEKFTSNKNNESKISDTKSTLEKTSVTVEDEFSAKKSEIIEKTGEIVKEISCEIKLNEDTAIKNFDMDLSPKSKPISKSLDSDKKFPIDMKVSEKNAKPETVQKPEAKSKPTVSHESEKPTEIQLSSPPKKWDRRESRMDWDWPEDDDEPLKKQGTVKKRVKGVKKASETVAEKSPQNKNTAENIEKSIESPKIQNKSENLLQSPKDKIKVEKVSEKILPKIDMKTLTTQVKTEEKSPKIPESPKNNLSKNTEISPKNKIISTSNESDMLSSKVQIKSDEPSASPKEKLLESNYLEVSPKIKITSDTQSPSKIKTKNILIPAILEPVECSSPETKAPATVTEESQNLEEPIKWNRRESRMDWVWPEDEDVKPTKSKLPPKKINVPETSPKITPAPKTKQKIKKVPAPLKLTETPLEDSPKQSPTIKIESPKIETSVKSSEDDEIKISDFDIRLSEKDDWLYSETYENDGSFSPLLPKREKSVEERISKITSWLHPDKNKDADTTTSTENKSVSKTDEKSPKTEGDTVSKKNTDKLVKDKIGDKKCDKRNVAKVTSKIEQNSSKQMNSQSNATDGAKTEVDLQTNKKIGDKTAGLIDKSKQETSQSVEKVNKITLKDADKIEQAKDTEKKKSAALDDKLSKINAFLSPKPVESTIKKTKNVDSKINTTPEVSTPESDTEKKKNTQSTELDEKMRKINAFLSPQSVESESEKSHDVPSTELDAKLSKINAFLAPKPSPTEDCKDTKSTELDEKLSKINAFLSPKVKEGSTEKIKDSKIIAPLPTKNASEKENKKPSELDEKLSKINAFLSPKSVESVESKTENVKTTEKKNKDLDEKLSRINAFLSPKPAEEVKTATDKNIPEKTVEKEAKTSALDEKMSKINAVLNTKQPIKLPETKDKKVKDTKPSELDEKLSKINAFLSPKPAEEKQEKIKTTEKQSKASELDEKLSKINAFLAPKSAIKEPEKSIDVEVAKTSELDQKLSKINAFLAPKSAIKEPEKSIDVEVAKTSELDQKLSKINAFLAPKTADKEKGAPEKKVDTKTTELDDKLSKINAWLSPSKVEEKKITDTASEIKSKELDDKLSKINAFLTPTKTEDKKSETKVDKNAEEKASESKKLLQAKPTQEVSDKTQKDAKVTKIIADKKPKSNLETPQKKAEDVLNTKIKPKKGNKKDNDKPTEICTQSDKPKDEVKTEISSEKTDNSENSEAICRPESEESSELDRDDDLRSTIKARGTVKENKKLKQQENIPKSPEIKTGGKKKSPSEAKNKTKPGSPTDKTPEIKTGGKKKSPSEEKNKTKPESPTDKAPEIKKEQIEDEKKSSVKKVETTEKKSAKKLKSEKVAKKKSAVKKTEEQKPKIKFPAPTKPLFMTPALEKLLKNRDEPIIKPLRRFKPVEPVVAPPAEHQVKITADRVSTMRHMVLKQPSVEDDDEDDSSSSSSEDEESSSSGSDTETESKPDRTSTSSEDSGIGSTHTSPLTNKNECSVNCHRKCEKHMPNLCGVNQKLLAEALCSVKKGRTNPGSTKKSAVAEGREGASPGAHPARRLSTSLSSDSESGEEGGGGSRRYTPPARTIPRFRKYTVDDYQFLKVLGKGSFGKVLLAELRGTDCYYAVKCLKKDVVLEDDDVECTLIERKVLALGTRHPYLCHLFCTFQTESHLFFVMEYLNGGDLMFHIQQSGRFDQARACFYAAEIVSGLKFLHKKGIVYRDLKLDNILLDYEGHVRIADFGMCKLQIYLDRTADTFCGTPDYMAPEIIKGLHYNQCVDWWSFGVLLYEMLIGQSPFNGCDEDELFWSICNEQPYYPRFLSKESQSILALLLDKDSSRRLGTPDCPAGDVYLQPFFKAIDWQALDRKELEPPFKPRVLHALDVQYFDTAFTQEAARLTPVDKEILQSMDQSQFHGFSYTNPNACNE